MSGQTFTTTRRVRFADCDGQRRFEATQTIVYVGRSLKPEPWPDALRARIAPFLEVQP